MSGIPAPIAAGGTSSPLSVGRSEHEPTQMRVELWTDGSGTLKGPGGWAFVLRAIDSHGVIVKEVEESGHELEATNNTMEMAAVISGLMALSKPTTLTVYCDSEYVVKGITSWIDGWERNGWRNKDGEPVANKAMWVLMKSLAEPHTITWRHIRGHLFHYRCDTCEREGDVEMFEKRGRKVVCPGCDEVPEKFEPWPLNHRCDALAGQARLAAKQQIAGAQPPVAGVAS